MQKNFTLTPIVYSVTRKRCSPKNRLNLTLTPIVEKNRLNLTLTPIVEISANEFVALTSTNTAKIFNIYPNKGCIRVGADADLVLWDPNDSKTLSAKTHQSNIEHSIFEGMTINGIPKTTICNGKLAWHDGKLMAKSGDGQYIDRPTYAPFYESLRKRQELNQPKAVVR